MREKTTYQPGLLKEKMQKKRFEQSDIETILALRDRNYSLGRIAREFKTNKPSILKALQLWDTGEQKTPDGKHFFITRGKVTMLPQRDEEERLKVEKEVQKEIKKSQKTLKKLQEKKE